MTGLKKTRCKNGGKAGYRVANGKRYVPQKILTALLLADIIGFIMACLHYGKRNGAKSDKTAGRGSPRGDTA